MNLYYAARRRPIGQRWWSTLSELLLLALALTSLDALAQDENDDALIFRNGDRLTGEVKRLERGRLFFDTDATGEIGVEWDEVAYLTSNRRLEIETESGSIFLGNLLNSEEASQLHVQTMSGAVEMPMTQVVIMTPIEETLLEQFDIDVTMGYSFTKASDLSQFNLGFDVDYRRERNGLSLSLDTVMTDETDDSTRRQNLNLSYDRFFDNRWVTRVLMSFERNDQLGIDLRSSVGAARGRFLRQTNQQRLALYGGLLLNREQVDGINQPAGADTTKDGVEAIGALVAEWFRYDEPELDVTSSLIVYPSLSESGRVRTELDLSVRWEILSDLFWDVTVYHDFDSDPPNTMADKADYGVITSVGWEF